MLWLCVLFCVRTVRAVRDCVLCSVQCVALCAVAVSGLIFVYCGVHAELCVMMLLVGARFFLADKQLMNFNVF